MSRQIPVFRISYFTYGLFVAVLITTLFFNPTDPTDGSKRSGMAWYKDHGTGCEYIASVSWLGFARGDLKPRLNAKGEHVCNGTRQEMP